jgi:hypothetical protein
MLTQPWKRQHASVAWALLDQSDEVALGVADERLPLIGPGRSERVVVMAEDHMGFALNRHSCAPQSENRGIYVVDSEVVQCGWRPPVEQEPDATEVEEHQPGGVKGRGWTATEQVSVEVGSTRDIVRVLSDLHERHL